METIPVELLEHILQFVPNNIHLSLVSKKWYDAVYGQTKLNLKANKTVLSTGVNEILGKFKSLQSLLLGYGHICSPHQLHKVAIDFRGSRTITEISCISDYVIYGAIRCPRLTTLRIPLHQAGVRDILVVNEDQLPEFDILKHRDLVFIFNEIPMLKHLHLDSPTWLFGLGRPYHLLQSLVLTSMDGDTMKEMAKAFQKGFNFPVLKKLKIDMDHRVLQHSTLASLSLGCPALKEIKFSYITFNGNAVDSICESFPTVTSLRFTRCEYLFSSQCSWAHRISKLTSRLKYLKELSIRYVPFHDGPSCPSFAPTETHQLEKLKIFQIEQAKLTTKDLSQILYCHPELKTLKVDLEHNQLQFTMEMADSMQQIESLGLRFGKEISKHDYITESSPILLPKLKHLSVWGYISFPRQLLLLNAHRIDTLELKYALCAPEKEVYELPRLKKLYIRAITLKAQDVCLKTLSSLVNVSPKLEYLTVEAINHKTNCEMKPDILHFLGKTCPRIKSLKTLNFKLPNHSLAILSQYWPGLTELSLKGSHVMGPITERLENEYLLPILESHPLLSSLSLAVAGIEMNHPRFSLMERHMILREYEQILTESFPQCTISIRTTGPDYFHYNR